MAVQSLARWACDQGAEVQSLLGSSPAAEQYRGLNILEQDIHINSAFHPSGTK